MDTAEEVAKDQVSRSRIALRYQSPVEKCLHIVSIGKRSRDACFWQPGKIQNRCTPEESVRPEASSGPSADVFLEPAAEPTSCKRYRRQAAAWPPPAGYLAAGPVGFTYYVQTWFRYYFQQYLESAFHTLETKEGLYSLDFVVAGKATERAQSDARGALVDRGGKWWEVEPPEQRQRGLDISALTLEWVNHTEDALFKVYSRDVPDLLPRDSAGRTTPANSMKPPPPHVP